MGVPSGKKRKFKIVSPSKKFECPGVKKSKKQYCGRENKIFSRENKNFGKENQIFGRGSDIFVTRKI